MPVATRARTPFVLRNSGALTQYVCPAPCGATVVFSALGAGRGYSHVCDLGHTWLRQNGQWLATWQEPLAEKEEEEENVAIIVGPSGGSAPVIPNGLYSALITNVEEIQLPEPDAYGNTRKVEISLEVEVDDELVNLDPRVNVAWGEKSTLFQVVLAAGFDPDPLGTFTLDDLVGRHLRVLIEQEQGRWPRVLRWQRAPQQKRARSPLSEAQITPDGKHRVLYDLMGDAVVVPIDDEV